MKGRGTSSHWKVGYGMCVMPHKIICKGMVVVVEGGVRDGP